jgi:hypothetical protein
MSDDDFFDEDEGMDMDSNEEEELDLEEEDDAYHDSSPLKREKSFEILSEAEIADEANKLISTVTDILGLEDASFAGILLRHFK